MNRSAAGCRSCLGRAWVGVVSLVLAGGCAPSPGGNPATTAPSPSVRAARGLLDQGRTEQAVAEYDRALRTNPRDGLALLEVVSLLLSRNRAEEARARAHEILQRAPDFATGHLAMAEVAYGLGNRKEARELLDRAAALNPDTPSFFPAAARLYHSLARTARGVELLQTARARGLADFDSLELLGDLCLKLTRPREAVEAYRAALRVEPNSADLHRNLGRALLMLNRQKEAEEALHESLRLRPEDPYALYYLGSLRLGQGKAQEAADLLSRSLRRDELNPKARYALAQALLKLGKKKEAEAEFVQHARLMERLYHSSPQESTAHRDRRDLSPGAALEWEEPTGPPHRLPPGTGEVRSLGSEENRRFWFEDVAAEAEIRLRNVSGGPDKDYIIESLGSGACWIDYDGDGSLDLYLVNGQPLAQTDGSAPSDVLYRNRGDGTFQEVTSRAGIRDSGWGHGCAVGDIDNDGDPDLYVTNRGANALYRNRGDGTFIEVGRAAGVDDPGWSASAAFADYDADGFLDLVVAEYVEFDQSKTQRPGSAEFCRFLGMPVFCGPRGLPMARNRLYRNRGNGTFEDVTVAAGFHTDRGYYSLGVVWGDLDNDGDPDLYVATDSTPNLLYRNNGDGTFTDVATEAGVAFNEEGREQAGMGTDMGDYDNDGDMDLVVTNFSHDVNTLYRQDSPGTFSDVSYSSGIGEPSLLYLGWGVGWVDLDNDGWKDLFVANGHTQPQVDQYGLATTYRERNLLFANLHDGTFREVGKDSGPGMALITPSRGAAFADYDNDGDVDVLVNNIDELPNLLRNETGNRSHWIGLKLIGTRATRDAVGARVTLKVQAGIRMGEVHPGYSYLSSNDPRLLFGLGSAVSVDEIRIRWPKGSIQILRDLPIDCYSTIKESTR